MFIARQPIFDRAMQVYGYELLFRATQDSSTYTANSPEASTAAVMEGLFESGLEEVVGSAKAFVNFNYNLLISDTVELIGPETMVIEVLENTKADDVLLERIQTLKQRGYRIALDDFEEDIRDFAIVPYADIIKYDIMITPLDQIRADVEIAKRKRKILLAEKIEKEEDFLKAKEMGFQLFQGYFFSKPKIVTGIHSHKTTNVVYQQILTELHKPEPSIQHLTEIIETDVNMAYRVMRVAGNVQPGEKLTIRKALVKMGLKELERWINVLMLQELANDKPPELVRLSLVRSHFAEQIAAHSVYASRKIEISLMLLFSLLDAMLDEPMEEALKNMPLSEDIKDFLIYKKGRFAPLAHIIEQYEQGNWEHMTELAQQIKTDPIKLSKWYLDALHWADRIVTRG
jgi:c-di-GMP-related signal transduction protein